MKLSRFEDLDCWKEARKRISKASAAEVQSLSYAALDQGYFAEEMRKAIYDQAEKVASLNSGMIKYLKRSSGLGRRDPKSQ